MGGLPEICQMNEWFSFTKDIDARRIEMEKSLHNEIREIQLQQIQLIKVFKEICEKEHLQYFMIGGTMLGAIRHKGYIPWDDDADFAMPREDYEKLLSKAPTYLHEPFRLENYLFDSNYYYYFSRMTTSQLRIEFPDRVKKRGENIGFDIFPFDGMPDNRVLFTLHLFGILAKRALYSYSVFDEKVGINESNRSGIQKILIFVGKHFKIEKLFSQKKRWAAFDKALKKYSPEHSKWLIHGTTGWISPGMGYKKNEPYRGIIDIYKKDIFGEGAFYEFEGMQLRGPKDYKAYLAQHFGDDYMTLPPESERYAHKVRIIESGEHTNNA